MAFPMVNRMQPSPTMSAGRQGASLRGGRTGDSGFLPGFNESMIPQTAGTPQTPNLTSIMGTWAPGIENSSQLDHLQGRYVTASQGRGAKLGAGVDLRSSGASGSGMGFF